jgi:hypothetical protein
MNRSLLSDPFNNFVSPVATDRTQVEVHPLGESLHLVLRLPPPSAENTSQGSILLCRRYVLYSYL